MVSNRIMFKGPMIILFCPEDAQRSGKEWARAVFIDGHRPVSFPRHVLIVAGATVVVSGKFVTNGSDWVLEPFFF